VATVTPSAPVASRTAGDYTGVCDTAGQGVCSDACTNECAGATFTVTITAAGAATAVTVVAAGTDYEAGDVITVPAAQIGGGGAADDLEITVDTVTARTGAITSFTKSKSKSKSKQLGQHYKRTQRRTKRSRAALRGR